MEELAPSLEGRRVALRPLTSGDYEYLRLQEQAAPDVAFYRHRGWSVSPEAYPESLWSSVLTQHLIVENSTDRVVGIVASYGYDQINGTAKFAIFVFLPFRGLGWPMEACRILFSYLFLAFPIRKLYAEVLAPNLAQFGRGFPTLLYEEGRLREHSFAGGRYVDQHILSITRERWFQDRRGFAGSSGLLELWNERRLGDASG